ncbi:MAG: DNA recombination protein RmuC [bacterium]|nr:DNA recombination protein RmuC [bacterium]
MDKEALTLLGVFLFCFAGLVYFFNKKLGELLKNKPDQSLWEEIKMVRASMENLQGKLAEGLDRSNKNVVDTLFKNTASLNARLDKAAEVIGALQKEAGQFSEISRSMKSLQDFLQSPKLRGNIGERVLTDMLSQVFPKNQFFLQHQFRSGEKVDAALKTDAGMLCIDSKFPMENFQKMLKGETETERTVATREFSHDVRKHIDAIAKKYILPDEGTMDFAMMYVPSESVYYEIINNMELMEHARNRHVYPVSPTSLYAHLQIILRSLEGREFEKKSREVLTHLRAIQQETGKFGELLSVLSRHVTNAYNQMSTVVSGFSQLGQKINNVQRLSAPEDEQNPQPPTA